VSDGGSALLLCSEAGLLASSLRPSDAVELLCSSTRTCSLYDAPDDLTCLSTCASAASSAYAEAKVSACDIDVAEVHDCFTISELMMYEALQLPPVCFCNSLDRYEALQLCSPGSAARMLRAHETDLSGRMPVNTGGGLVGFGHPVGATGVKQVVEVWRQMKGKCGDYQLKRIPQLGVCANMGGEFECSRIVYSVTCA
jgi:acetyl-CoA acyltransferase